MSNIINKNLQEWLDGPIDALTKKKLIDWKNQNNPILNDLFSHDLEFGTGGIRAIMDIGINRLNLHSISKLSIGVGNYFLKKNVNKPITAVISYDNRINSKEFAEKSAEIFSKLGIKVYITSNLRPTPFVSFLIRHIKAQFGVMITASHNPKEYNGYKVYGEDGAQVVFPDDKKIEESIKSYSYTDVFNLNSNFSAPIVHTKTDEDLVYLSMLDDISIHKKQDLDFGDDLKILYSNLHGTGLTLIPYALKQLGFTNLHYVEKQMSFDGNFPFAPSPNPEDIKALSLGLELFEKDKYDLFLATDPDADRLAAVVNHMQKPYILSGNEMAIVCLYHLLQQKKQRNELTNKTLVVSTVVSSRLLKKISNDFSICYEDVLTGFKYIGEKIKQLDEKNLTNLFLFGAEESYGFLYGTYSRDKDGIAAGCLIAEIVLHYKLKGLSLVDVLDDIYQSYGLLLDGQITINLADGNKGLDQKNKILSLLETDSIISIDNIKILKIHHFEKGFILDPATKECEKTGLTITQGIGWELEDDSQIIIRPSGTEPKIKIYANYSIKSFLDIKTAKKECEEHLKKRLANVKNTLLSYL